MGMRTFFFLFLCVGVFSLDSFGAGPKNNKCTGVIVSEVVKKLDYVGVKFTSEKGFCVEANNDREALKACSAQGGVRIINPGNPQYSNDCEGSTRTANTLGYYLCFKSAQNDKKTICQDLMVNSKNSSYNNRKSEGELNYVNFKWTSHGINGDGDCNCNHPNSKYQTEKNFRECNQKFKDDTTTETTTETLANTCKTLKGDFQRAYQYDDGTQFEAQCMCGANKIDLNKTEVCDLPKEAKTAVTESQPPSEALIKCLNDHASDVKKCTEKSTEALRECKQSIAEEKKSNKDTMGMVSNFSKLLINAKAGSGEVAQCAGASILASGAAALLNAMKKTCSSEIEACTESCKVAEKRFIEFCKHEIKDFNEDEESPSQKLASEYDQKYSGTIAESIKTCTVDAQKEKSLISTGLSAYDASQSSAATCACKFSAAGPPPGVPDCNSMPPISNCSSVPTPPGCSGVGTLFCELGSPDYALPKCQCFRDPSLGICKAPAGQVPFAFAGDVRALTGGATIGTPLDASGGVGNMDLGSFNQQDLRSDKPEGALSAPGMSAGNLAAGGGGGGGAPGGGADGSGANAGGGDGDPKDKGLGFLSALKSSVSGLFGGKGNSNSANDKLKNSRATPNVEGWRPRGLASSGCKASQVRCKNETIWDIMSSRYDTKDTTFIKNP